MAADAVHERAKIRRRQAGDGGMTGKGGVRRAWCLMEVRLREKHAKSEKLINLKRMIKYDQVSTPLMKSKGFTILWDEKEQWRFV